MGMDSEDSDGGQNKDQCGRNSRRGGTAQNNAEEEERREDRGINKSRGAQKDREREERLLTSTGGRSHNVLLQNPGKPFDLGFRFFLKCQ